MPQYNVVVVGGGFAGLSAALAARDQGASVAIVSKLHPLRSQSSGAHSGINAALLGDDTWKSHALDTIKAGAYLSDQDIVANLCKEARDHVISIEHMGVPFDRNKEGRINQTRFAGSTEPRTCYCNDSSGHNILQVLFEQTLRSEIPLFHEWLATSLIMSDGKCKGVFARNLKDGKLESFSAGSIVLATGGIGQMYRTSTSSTAATADGPALAYRVGAALRDMEMVQFTPTSLKSQGILITEAARAEGAFLKNADGNRFMDKYAVESMEMATGDICARAVAQEITDDPNKGEFVYLDFQHLDPEILKNRLPETTSIVKDLTGIDVTKALVPVRPAMHRPIGGIKIDEYGSTSVPGLYAAGECANSGLNGANRLGGNTLLDCITIGRRSGIAGAEQSKNTSESQNLDSLKANEEKRLQAILSKEQSSELPGALRRELGLVMENYVGVSRDAKGLKEASKKIAQLAERCETLGARNLATPYSTQINSILELTNMLDIADTIVTTALARKESRGTHYRKDFPKRDDKHWLKHSIIRSLDDECHMEYEPVIITDWKPEGSI